MRNVTRVLCALLLAVLTCVGQTSKPPEQNTKKPRPEREGEIPLPTARVVGDSGSHGPDVERRVGLVGVKYRQKESETTASVAFEVYRRPPVQIMLSYDFTVPGKDVVRPEAVEVTASSNADVFGEGTRLVIEADGKQFRFKPHTAGCFERKCPNAGALVPFETFEQLSRSQSVKVRAGRFEFELKELGREAMRDMVRAVESPAKP